MSCLLIGMCSCSPARLCLPPTGDGRLHHRRSAARRYCHVRSLVRYPHRSRHWNKKSRQQRLAGTGEGYLKTGVIGAIPRKGNVVCRVIGDQDAKTLAGFVRKVISDKVDLVATDENQDCNYLGKDIPHEAVSHSRGEYVRGNVHNNNIESFWRKVAFRPL
jgi:hypothetical protein